MCPQFRVSTNIHNGSSNPSNRFYRLIILNLTSQIDRTITLNVITNRIQEGNNGLSMYPVLSSPVCSETVEDKIDKISSGKGRQESGLSVGATTSSALRYNKFAAPCESEVSLLLGHTLRIACTLNRRNNAAYKSQRLCSTRSIETFYRETHFSRVINFEEKFKRF